MRCPETLSIENLADPLLEQEENKRHVFHVINHFHQSYLNQIHD
jgi:hypothetical protein